MAGQPRRSGRQNSEAWGTQRGNTRGKERQKRRHDLRMKDPRVRNALEDARNHQVQLDQTLVRSDMTIGEHEHSAVHVGNPPRYSCCGRLVPPPPAPEHKPVLVRTVIRKEEEPSLPVEGDGNGRWTLGQARSMLRQGYLLARVVERTGFGTKWFNDMKIVDERGVPLEEEHA